MREFPFIPDEVEGDDGETQPTLTYSPRSATYHVQLNFHGTRQPGGSWEFTDHQGRITVYVQNPMAFRAWAWGALMAASGPFGEEGETSEPA